MENMKYENLSYCTMSGGLGSISYVYYYINLIKISCFDPLPLLKG